MGPRQRRGPEHEAADETSDDGRSGNDDETLQRSNVHDVRESSR
jgi:hypothetical protein